MRGECHEDDPYIVGQRQTNTRMSDHRNVDSDY